MTNATLIFTGGHHTSALNVAKALKSRRINIIWLGHRQSMWNDKSDSAEFKDVTSYDIPFYDLQAGKFYRSYNPIKLLRIPLGFIRAFVLILRLKLKYRSDLKGIVSFGGYLAVPVVFCGWLLRIPSVTHEQTLTAGWANKFISVFVKKIVLTWPSSKNNFPNTKTEVTGLPLDSGFFSLKFKTTVPPTVYITGGKQGSHTINQAVFSVLPELVKKYFIVHQTGHNSVTGDFETAKIIQSRLPPEIQPRYQVYDYLPNKQVQEIYSKSSVVVGRSGAHTVYELALIGLPCVLIPIPKSSHGEQMENANFLVRRNQAVLVNQEKLTPKLLLDSINSALLLKPKPMQMVPDSLEKIISIINQEFNLY